jgi:hypothetical protein
LTIRIRPIELAAQAKSPTSTRKYAREPAPASGVPSSSPPTQAAGFAARNRRTQADNAPEAMLSLVTNTAVPSGLKPSVASRQRSSTVPYIVPA